MYASIFLYKYWISLLLLFLFSARYCLRAKRMLSKLDQQPLVVELDLRGITLAMLFSFNCFLYEKYAKMFWTRIVNVRRRWWSNSERSCRFGRPKNCSTDICEWQAYWWLWWLALSLNVSTSPFGLNDFWRLRFILIGVVLLFRSQSCHLEWSIAGTSQHKLRYWKMRGQALKTGHVHVWYYVTGS